MKCSECGNWGAHKMDCSNRPIRMMPPIQWTAGQVSPTPTPTPTPFVQPIPLVPGFAVGLRAWLVANGGDLQPIAMHNAPPWEPGENLAQCFVRGDGSDRPCRPDCQTCLDAIALRGNRHGFDPKCSCGFYGVWEADKIPVVNRGIPMAYGVVKVYGRTVIGPAGWRAEKAQVLALAAENPTIRNPFPPPYPPAVLAKWHAVPRFPFLSHAIREFPPTDPEQYLTTAREE
jgi:hypothetical protein